MNDSYVSNFFTCSNPIYSCNRQSLHSRQYSFSQVLHT